MEINFSKCLMSADLGNSADRYWCFSLGFFSLEQMDLAFYYYKGQVWPRPMKEFQLFLFNWQWKQEFRRQERLKSQSYWRMKYSRKILMVGTRQSSWSSEQLKRPEIKEGYFCHIYKIISNCQVQYLVLFISTFSSMKYL